MKRTPLGPLHEARGARWMEHHGWEIPRCYAAVADEYHVLQEGVGLIDLSHRGKLRVTGRDRRTWLHGQVTQEINGLPEWRGAYATLLTPQGRMVSDMRVFALPEALLADVPAGTATPIPAYLDRYLVMERAEIEDLTDSWAILSLQGPQSAAAVGCLLGEAAAALPLWGVMEHPFQGGPLYAARTPHCGEDGFDLFVPAGSAAALWASLSLHRTRFAVHSVGWDALNLRRLEAGIPWWGEELDESVVPLEARLNHAISLRKGCYVGQEIIARIDARGQVNHLLAGFRVLGETLPARGAEIRHGGRKAGVLRTAARSPRLGAPIALGYLRRELQEAGTRVEAAGEPPVELEVTPLPFVPHDLPPAAGPAAGATP